MHSLAPRFLFDLGLRCLAATAFALCIFVAVFLAEVASGTIENVIHSGMPISALPRIMLLTAPEIVILAAPLALLLGSMRTFATARQNSELLGLVSFGIGPARVIGAMAVFALLFQLVVLVVAGFVDPLSRLARETMFQNANQSHLLEVMRNGLAVGQTRTIRNVTIIAPLAEPGSRTRLFIAERRENGVERVVTADRYEIIGPDRQERYLARLYDVDALEVARADPSRTATERSDQAGEVGTQEKTETHPEPFDVRRIGASTADQLIDFRTITGAAALFRQPAYRTLYDLLADSAAGPDQRRMAHAHAVKTIARSALCMVAMFAALLAVSFASRRGQLLIAPVACVIMISIDTISIGLIDKAAESFVTLYVASAVWISVLLCASAGLAASRFAGLVMPGRSA